MLEAWMLETERLLLRQIGEGDLPALAAMLQDAETMAAWEHVFSDDEVRGWLKNQQRRYREDGFGPWAVCEKVRREAPQPEQSEGQASGCTALRSATRNAAKVRREASPPEYSEQNAGGPMVGQCGISWQAVPPGLLRGPGGEALLRVPEIGYLFNRAYWHRGYATEAALACRAYAFDVLGFGAVYAIIRDNNAASRAVARRCGMAPVGGFVKRYRGMEMPHTVYEVRNPAGE